MSLRSLGARSGARTGARSVGGYVVYAIIAVYVLAAVAGPYLVPYDPVATVVTERLLPPGSATASGTAWLGTDGVGRDVFAQVVHGARTSLTIGIVVVLVCSLVGVALGAVAGYAGGFADVAVARTIDVLMAFPGILLAIVIAGLLDRGVDVVIIALSVAGWIGFARLSRSVALSIRERDWVDAARIMGVRTPAVLTRHVVPFLAGPVVALATMELASVVLSEAALSFLGLGLPPYIVSWGQSIAGGKEYLATAWWISAFPGIALSVLVVCIGLVGDRLTKRFAQR
jgi:peptide/nickel transport system permease protein